ncbi:MAG: SpoIIE family protein phosphatase [Anaerolineae bacterium]|nr:SpoIIE family protein phosphatase [Anaerolineae bacterium]
MKIAGVSEIQENRIKQLESELEEMTVAVVHAWDQLAALMNASPQATNPTQDAVSVIEAIMTAVDAELGAIFLIEREDSPAQYFVIPSNIIDAQAMLQRLGDLHNLAAILTVNHLPIWNGSFSDWLFAPIRVNQDVVGVVGVGHGNDQRKFTASEARILLRMTERAAGYIAASSLALSHEREQRLAHEMEIAGLIQRSLQPLGLPNSFGVDVAAHWQPAQNVGGDAWGWVQQPDGTLACFILDVAGKGIPAALAAVALHNAIKITLHMGLDPVDVLRTVNEEVYDSYTNANLIATATILTYHPWSRQLTCTSAGHPPTLVKTTDTWLSWRANFPPLGMIPDYEITENSSCHRVLYPGDLVVCFSDGYTEIEVGNGLWGVQGVRAVIPDEVDSAEQVVTAVRQAADKLESDGILHDDQTLLVLHI